jgi:hypothetical protein
VLESRALGAMTGLAATYLVLSLVVLSLVEIFSSATSRRARVLRDAVVDLIGEEMGGKVLGNPAVNSLGFVRPTGPSKGEPSYIPSHLFARALLAELGDASADPSVAAVGDLVSAVVGDPGVPLEEAERRLAVWFDSAMDRLSGAYKRDTQKASLILAALVTLAANVDSIHLLKVLWSDASVSARVGALSKAATAACEDDAQSPDCRKDLVAFLKNGDTLPFGWNLAELKALDAKGWASFIVGLALTVLAVSRGSPFWFDFLRRFSPGMVSVGPRPALANTSAPAPAPVAAPSAKIEDPVNPV